MQRHIDHSIERDLQQRPRLRQACLQLEEMARQLQPGDKLPPMVALRAQLGMSFSTLTAAVRELERRGVLQSASGVGVYVAEPRAQEVKRKLGLLFRIGAAQNETTLFDFYVANLLSGVRRAAALHDFEIVLLDEQTECVPGDKVDALILYCHLTEALAMNLPSQLPHVLLFQHSPDFACVVPDDFEGAKIATTHLLELGHRRIAYMPASQHDSISRQRQAGFYAAHHNAAIEVSPEQIRYLPPKSRQCSYRELGEREMAAWLAENWQQQRCTAILAHNDHAAIGMIKALRAAGLRVPQDVSVVGFDGTEISNLCTPSLTSIRVPLAEIGARAVKVLLEQIAEGKIHTEKNMLPVSLKKGDSAQHILTNSLGKKEK